MANLKNLFSPELPSNVGKEYLSWTFPEFIQEKKTKVWYLVILSLLILLVVYAVLSSNFLFAVILVLGVMIVVVQFFQKSRSIEVSITDSGAVIDGRFYSYRHMKSFWIIYEPPRAKYLYFELKSGLKGSFPVPLEDINPLKVREALLLHLQEDLDKDSEEIDEIFAKLLNIH